MIYDDASHDPLGLFHLLCFGFVCRMNQLDYKISNFYSRCNIL